LESFAYDKKQKSIVKRTRRKRKTTLDNGVLCTSEEVIIDTNKAKLSQLYSPGLAISYASFDKEIMEERELEQVRIEIVSLKHQVQYHQKVRGVTNFKKDLLEVHEKCLKVQEDLEM